MSFDDWMYVWMLTISLKQPPMNNHQVGLRIAFIPTKIIPTNCLDVLSIIPFIHLSLETSPFMVQPRRDKTHDSTTTNPSHPHPRLCQHPETAMSAFRPSFTPFLLPLLLYLFSRHTPISRHSTHSETLLSSVITTRLNQLSNISSTPHVTNRPYLSSSSKLAQNLLVEWMRSSSLDTRIDAAGNVIGDLRCSHSPRKHVLLGSHHDTVPSAGRFDGLLGVVTSISVAQILSSRICDLPFDIRVVAFDDEEGNNNFGSTNLGAKAYSGILNITNDIGDRTKFIQSYTALHPGKDAIQGLYSAKAEPPLAYLELHIEQGPVLEGRNAAVGVVDAIAGQTRLRINFDGEAGHAGTVPMEMRRDALTTAAECILAVETVPEGVVGTVGRVSTGPGVGNVIPGSADLSVDIRAKDDDVRRGFVKNVVEKCVSAGVKRGVVAAVEVLHEVDAVGMTEWMVGDLVKLVDGGLVTSGAGHDAQIMGAVTDVGMLFVRCKGGVSHTPEEFVDEKDVLKGGKALLDAVLGIAKRF